MSREYSIVSRSLLYAISAACILVSASSAFAADNQEYQAISTLYKQGQYAQALDRDNAWIARHPKDAQARFLKGLILTEQNKTKEAIAVFTALTEDFPELPEPYNNLAVLYAAQGDYDKARNALEMAIHTHPSYAIAHENLGDIYAKMASIAYDKALQLDTRNNTVHTKLELIHEIFADHPSTIQCTGTTPDKASGKTAPVSATTPAATAAPATKSHADGQQAATSDAPAISAMIKAWASAWSKQDADAYLAFYAPQFKTPDNMPRDRWENQRRARIGKPRHISVQLSDLEISQRDTHHAAVEFTENYQSNLLSSVSRKAVSLVRIDGKWMIEQESAH